MERDKVTTLEQAYMVLVDLGADDLAEDVLALLDELDLMGLIDDEASVDEMLGRAVQRSVRSLVPKNRTTICPPSR